MRGHRRDDVAWHCRLRRRWDHRGIVVPSLCRVAAKAATIALSANLFWAGLDEPLLGQAIHGFADEERYRRHWTTPRNFPRNGLPLRKMNDGQAVVSSSDDETMRLWDLRRAAVGQPTILRIPGPYAGMQIGGVTGISDAQKAALVSLGAVELSA
ncbi:MAG TPA: hypothetical protein P5121_35040 [Caldilineaceae bacterium]|nr:hypothetical protein [Caldilineaceae bacterium]